MERTGAPRRSRPARTAGQGAISGPEAMADVCPKGVQNQCLPIRPAGASRGPPEGWHLVMMRILEMALRRIGKHLMPVSTMGPVRITQFTNAVQGQRR